MATITNALNIAATVAEVFSLGGAIAYGLDIVDGKSNKFYYYSSWYDIGINFGIIKSVQKIFLQRR